MQKIITCTHCGKTVPANPRLKSEQIYCNNKACQNIRKKLWYQQKLATDPGYAKRQKECKKQWRKNKPAHRYQNQYRQTHPEYVEKNRIQQRLRNQKRQKSNSKDASKKIVKIDTFELGRDKTSIYQLKILNHNLPEKIVKIDTLIVQLHKYQPISP